jgi:hypothetical protein
VLSHSTPLTSYSMKIWSQKLSEDHPPNSNTPLPLYYSTTL